MIKTKEQEPNEVEEASQKRRENKPRRGVLHWLARPIPFLSILGIITFTPLIGFFFYWRSQQLPNAEDQVIAFYQAIIEKDKEDALELLNEEQRRESDIALNFVMLSNVYLEYQVLDVEELEPEDGQIRERANVRVNGVATYNYQGADSEITFSDVIKLDLIEEEWILQNASLGDLFEIQ